MFYSGAQSHRVTRRTISIMASSALLLGMVNFGTPLAGKAVGSLNKKVSALARASAAKTTAAGSPTAAKLPVVFEANEGQTDGQVQFLARAGNSTLFLTQSDAILKTPKDSIRIRLQGSQQTSSWQGIEPKAGKANYFKGNDSSKWISGVSTFGKAVRKGVYPGIDMVFYGAGSSQLEYDFIVAAGANPSQIVTVFEGATGLSVAETGDLTIETGDREITQRRPFAYQRIAGRKNAVEVAYFINAKNEVGYKVGRYDDSLPLVIDPILQSTYLGGSGTDTGKGLALDPGCVSSCAVYLTGATQSADFPTSGAFDATCGSDSNCNGGASDVYVTKLDSSGAIAYSTYLGGSSSDSAGNEGNSIAVDSAGNVYVVGGTGSTDFPVQNPIQGALPGGGDAFLAKLNPSGSSLVYSTYLGGTGEDSTTGIALDSAGNAFVLGYSQSTNWPGVSAGSLQEVAPGEPGNWNLVFAKINGGGSSIVYSTYLGGSDLDAAGGISVDGDGKVHISGFAYSSDFPTTGGSYKTIGAGDPVVMKINPDPADGAPAFPGDSTDLVFGTYLGGSSEESQFVSLALDPGCVSNCNTYISTETGGGYPTTGGAFQTTIGGSRQIAVSKLNATGTQLIYSTFVGGAGDESSITRIAVDAAGNAYVAGGLFSGTGFPVASPIKGTPAGSEALLFKLNPQGTGLVYSTYLGGSGEEENADNGKAIAVDGSGQAYITGYTRSADFPTKNAQDSNLGGSTDAFFTKLSAAAKERKADFNAEGTPDLSVYRNGIWYLKRRALPRGEFNAAISWGGHATDKPVPGDYNADGFADPAVYRNGIWYINYQQNGVTQSIEQISWGGDGSDIPAPADYDGDGDTDLAVYRVNQGIWYINLLEGEPNDIQIVQWGGDPSDKPVPGDYDADGDVDIALYRGATGYWYVYGQPSLETQWGGNATDEAVPGDYDKDGDTDLAVYRVNAGRWYINAMEGLPSDISEVSWGGDPTDVPVAADWDTDGDTDVAVYRGGTWYVNLRNGLSDFTRSSGISTNGSTTYTKTSESGNNFPTDVVGLEIVGTNIQPDTVIVNRVGSTNVTLSKPATGTGTGLTFTLNRGDVRAWNWGGDPVDKPLVTTSAIRDY